MKYFSIFSGVLCLLLGFLIGMVIPVPWAEETPSGPVAPVNGVISAPSSFDDAASSGASSSLSPGPLDRNDNFPLLNAACLVNRALKDRDYDALASLVHPTKGVTFTPYSTVNFETDLTFTASQIRELENDKTVYTWGFVDGRGSLIELTMSQYLEQYVFNTDYTQAPQIGVDQIIISGNALENLTEAYPGCRFVDFSFPSLDSAKQGMDWCSLKLVFEPDDTGWWLVGIVHGQWTI